MVGPGFWFACSRSSEKVGLSFGKLTWIWRIACSSSFCWIFWESLSFKIDLSREVSETFGVPVIAAVDQTLSGSLYLFFVVDQTLSLAFFTVDFIAS